MLTKRKMSDITMGLFRWVCSFHIALSCFPLSLAYHIPMGCLSSHSFYYSSCLLSRWLRDGDGIGDGMEWDGTGRDGMGWDGIATGIALPQRLGRGLVVVAWFSFTR